MATRKRHFPWYIRRAFVFVPLCVVILFLLVSLINFDTRRTVAAVCETGLWGSSDLCNPATSKARSVYDAYTDQLVTKYELKHFFLSDMAFRHHAGRLGFKSGTNYTFDFSEKRCHIYMRGVDEQCIEQSSKARRTVLFYDIRSFIYLGVALAGMAYAAYRLFVR